ncbi:Piso0_005329 [Millerozyma farinosa CBS 7064]|uniref:Piso0_005329 protein n=1 Tax=Pichia sorbitophila (strain ATCC MYA-4447 / BCRC 22081 / CBS 7064 / NBRC 10061 / NRRL Y-12695) TaxID=559304 RepID=G8Y1W3_PICSO|nr:Piso0_005329 [Millerozyma farinosa CBS 7064]
MAATFPTPVFKTFWPFAAGASITYFLVYKASVASMNSSEFINDPRHPRFAKGGKFIDLKDNE